LEIVFDTIDANWLARAVTYALVVDEEQAWLIGPAIEGDQQYNTRYTYATDGSGFDVQGVATHELGHTLGLGHAADASCLTTFPYASAPGGVEARSLGDGEVLGI